MMDQECYQFLSGIFARVFERNDIVLSPDLTAEDVYGWDLFKQVELLIEIQDALATTFSTQEMDGLRNVGDLARLVQAHDHART